MPTIRENLRAWNTRYGWEARGDEWSVTWGGPEPQWQGAILPRISAYLPAGHILEIAPGYGRWTRFLARFAEVLTIVDLAPECIAVCQERFRDQKQVRCFVNDGRSLDMVADRSIDFAFTFDSLVHAELPVMESYLRELARVLAPNGVAFLHHSNLAAFGPRGLARRWLPNPVCRRLMDRGIVPADHWRAYSVSADLVRDVAAAVGVPCIRQELVNWGCDRLIDCFSTLTPVGSTWSRPMERLENHAFMEEAAAIRQTAGARV
jgi:ubiquinone/menaquinone biosynthesis C-methylase UbiE